MLHALRIQQDIGDLVSLLGECECVFVCIVIRWTRNNMLWTRVTEEISCWISICLPKKWFPKNHFPNFLVFVYQYKNWLTENTFQSKENLSWFPRKCFPFILGGKHFPEIMKKLEISFYLSIISNLVFKLLIDIYFVWIFFF